MSQTVVKCPQCGKSVAWRPESRYRPFCSERCKTIDLGAWVAEEYAVGAENPADAYAAE
ncbi:DNA gyrase inhibitor YacG [Neisseria leonii]|uniref:DNA gyrase inhibitor YacG n=1 Tax=Neisseria leonii TaxID=2995413 RepID=A0A9X4E169_9NEIS|nr:DNA gyrase inhibitor YacG [Neisseria sp. 51.81]MDD9327635.1 DNA gyrase inhibitor YacG [Neisseria sp. 51.81]